MNQKIHEPQVITQLRSKIKALEKHYQDAQGRIAALYVIQEVTQSLTSELNLDPLLHKILAEAVKVVGASAGSLLLIDELTDELVFAVTEGGGGDDLEGIRMPGDKGLAGWVATHHTPLIVDDVNKDNRYYQSVANSFNFPLTSLLCVPMISHSKVIGVLQVLQSAPGRYFGEFDQQLLTTFASQAAIAIENARLYQSLKEERDRLVVVEDEIRKRLARDLHDGPTQILASIVMSLSFIKELIDRAPEHAPEEIDLTVGMADRALKQLRTLLFDLRPVILETQGLIPALEVYVERLRETDKLNIDLTIKHEFQRLSPRAEVAVFAVIQEAVNNAKKYADASHIQLAFQPDEAQDNLTIFIRDDGKGFDVNSVKNNYDARGSLGLINMQERTNMVNGAFKIHSKEGQGTEILLSLPISENLLDERDN